VLRYAETIGTAASVSGAPATFTVTGFRYYVFTSSGSITF
jgi:hypothetical protein